MRNQDLPVRAEYRGLPAVPADQVVTGLIPHEPPNFQTPVALELLRDSVCVVTGQRGVGKTQATAAYARQRVRDGWLVAWIGAETEDQIKAGMVELADRLGLCRAEDSSEVTAARVRNHLQTRPGPALLVFDNVVSLDTVRSYLPSVGTVQVVITSTARGSQIGPAVPVDVFTPETALRFLHEATGLNDSAAAAELAQELGYLPLALAQAAARIRAANWGYAKYLEKFRKFPAEKVLSRRDGDPYPLGAATAILMALEPFHGSELVELLSVLSPEGVSRQVLGDDADDELMELHEASLVEFAGTSSVIMHRLVQRVIRDRVSNNDALLRAARLLATRIQFDGNTWSYRHFGNELVRQIEALWTNSSATDTVALSELMIILRLWETSFLTAITDFSRANLIAIDLYVEVVARLGEDHRLAPQARHVVSIGMDNTPEILLVEVQNDFRKFDEELGAQHPTTLRTASLLSQCYRNLDRADEAIAVLERALEPWRDQRDQPDPADELLTALNELGSAYIAAGRADDAVALLEQTVHKGPAQGWMSLTARLTLSLLGDAYETLKRHDDARTVREQVWDTDRKTIGPDHPLTLLSANKLGITLIRCGEIDQATALFRFTLAIATEVLGQDHMAADLARSMLDVIQRD